MDKGFIRVPISGRHRAGTVLTFQGVTTAAAAALSSPAVTDDVSNFYAAGLVMAPVSADAREDILFSAAQFTAQTPIVASFSITKIANAQIGISWEVTISKGA